MENSLLNKKLNILSCIYFLGFILKYLRSLLEDGNDTNADVFIHCSNGVLPTHRLVLASISRMLLTVFKQDTWDEPIVIILPHFTTGKCCQEYKMNI